MLQYERGTRDLWFKISPDKGAGYRDYEHGTGGPTVILDRDFERDRGARANLDLFNMLQRTLDLPVVNE